MFESVSARKSRRINPVALLLVVCMVIGGFAVYRWYERRELEEAYASLGLTSPPPPVVPTATTRVTMPGWSIELRGPDPMIGDERDGRVFDALGNGVIWWTPAERRQSETIEQLSVDLGNLLLEPLRKHEPRAQLVASRAIQVDGRPAHAFVASPTREGTTYLTALKCGTLLVQFYADGPAGRENLELMTSTFHCTR